MDFIRMLKRVISPLSVYFRFGRLAMIRLLPGNKFLSWEEHIPKGRSSSLYAVEQYK